VAFSPDDRWLATAGGGSVGDVKIWDVKTGDEVAAREAHAGRTTAVAFSPDSKNLATGGGIWNGPGEFAVWDVTKQIRTGSFQIAEGGVLSLAYSPDGQTLAIGAGYVVGDTAKGAVRLWDITKGTESTTTLQGPPAEMTSLVYSHGGKSLIASTFHSDPQANQTLWEMKVWNAKTGRAQSVLDSNREQPLEAAFFNLRTLAVSDDGNIIAGAGRNGVNGLVKVWNVTTGTMSVLPKHAGAVWAVAVTGDGKTVATADNGAGTIRFWDVVDQKELPGLAAFSGATFALAFSPDGKHLVAGGVDATPGQERGVIKWWVRD
jgi:WD40 repeat protein